MKDVITTFMITKLADEERIQERENDLICPQFVQSWYRQWIEQKGGLSVW